MTKSPNTTGKTDSEVRCKGRYTDEELAREWLKVENFSQPYNTWSNLFQKDHERCYNRRIAIEKELGKDRLEFLVHKIKTEDKHKSLEDRIKALENPSDNKKMTGFCTVVNNSSCFTIDASSGGQCAAPRTPWYKRLWALLCEERPILSAWLWGCATASVIVSLCVLALLVLVHLANA